MLWYTLEDFNAAEKCTDSEQHDPQVETEDVAEVDGVVDYKLIQSRL